MSSRRSRRLLLGYQVRNILRLAHEHSTGTDSVLAAVVYFKNRVNKGWNKAEEGSTVHAITEREKAVVRSRLVPIIATSSAQTRAQLIVALQKILHYDFPKQWPDFVDVTIRLLNAGDVQSIFAGLQCLLAICRTYRFKLGDSRGDFDKIVEVSFPQLLSIGNSLVNETSLEAGEMLRTVLKAYKHAIYVSRKVAYLGCHYADGMRSLSYLCIFGRATQWSAGAHFSSQSSARNRRRMPCAKT